jgi:hypothetical protein
LITPSRFWMPAEKTVRARLTSHSISRQKLPALIQRCSTLVKVAYLIFVLDLTAVLIRKRLIRVLAWLLAKSVTPLRC